MTETDVKKIEVGDIAESFTAGFGKVTSIEWWGFSVKFPHDEDDRNYTFDYVERGSIKIHKQDVNPKELAKIAYRKHLNEKQIECGGLPIF